MEEMIDVLDQYGNYTNKIVSRKECHQKGFWHRAVVLFVISSDGEKILLQQRSAEKRLWPNLWDVTAGGHVLSKEFGYQAVLRETKEEIGLDISKEELLFIGSTISENKEKNTINRHFNEYYVVHKDIDLDELILQKEEVQDIKWYSKEEVIHRIKNNYEGLTLKKGCWEYLIKYFEYRS